MNTPMKKTPYKFYADPGHGWLAVKFTELCGLSIADKITQYSAMKGKTVYLEEDVDATTFINAKHARGERVETVTKHTNKSSPIRSYRRYGVGK